MSERAYRRVVYAVAAFIIILLGMASRLFSFGNLVIDKYLGDALYAVMIYLLLRGAWPTHWKLSACGAVFGILAIECFQLTGIPLHMRRGDSQALRLVSILLGTKFGWFDILAYAVGLLLVCWIDLQWLAKRKVRLQSQSADQSSSEHGPSRSV